MMEENLQTKRSFITGDSWVYYKIYTGHKTADLVLSEIISPLAQSLLDQGIIDQWFFIRYADPKFHIRLRLHSNLPENVTATLSSFAQKTAPYVAEKLIWNIQTGTYQRELERYGFDAMGLSEAIFFHDSQLITGLLGLIEGSEGEEIRWLFGLRTIDSLLNSFQYPLAEKLRLLEQLKTLFGGEFNMSRFLKKQMDDKFRKYRKGIESFMALDYAENEDLEPLFMLLYGKEQSINPLVDQLIERQKNGTLQVSMDDLLSSHIHMIMNRLFRSKNRLHELVLYDFLYRHYRSCVARLKYQNQKPVI